MALAIAGQGRPGFRRRGLRYCGWASLGPVEVRSSAAPVPPASDTATGKGGSHTGCVNRGCAAAKPTTAERIVALSASSERRLLSNAPLLAEAKSGVKAKSGTSVAESAARRKDCTGTDSATVLTASSSGEGNAPET